MRDTRTLTYVEDGANTRREEPLSTTRDGSPPNAAARRARQRGRFTEADLVKVLKAAQKAGTLIASVRIEPDGTILVVPGTPASVAISCTIQDAADIIAVD